MKKIFEIDNRLFESKKDLEEYIKEILHKYNLKSELIEEDFSFIHELLKKHPEYENKKGLGISAIKVDLDREWGRTRCFYLVRIDNTGTDFSYKKCLTPSINSDKKKNFSASARSAVRDQVIKFLNQEFFNKQDSSARIKCELSGKLILKDESDVDHIPPNTFYNIVQDFIINAEIEINNVEFVGFADNEFRREFKNEELRLAFSKYHKQVAKLRVISKKANLTQKKK